MDAAKVGGPVNAQATGGLDPTPPNPGAVALGLVPGIFLLCATILAFRIARREPRHRPVAVALATLAGAGLVRYLLFALVLPPAGPFAGWLRAAFHVDEALYLMSAAVPALLALATLRRFRPGPASRWLPRVLVAVYVAAWLALVLTYPLTRGDVLRRVYLGAEIAGLLVACATVGAWVIRRRTLQRERVGVVERLTRGWNDYDANTGMEVDEELRAVPRVTLACVLLLALAPVALLLVGAWRYGLFGAAYAAQQAGLLALYGCVAVAQAWAWWRGRAGR
jgi:hypothetical protein